MRPIFLILFLSFSSVLTAQQTDSLTNLQKLNQECGTAWKQAGQQSWSLKIPLKHTSENGSIVIFDGFAPNGSPEFKHECTNTDYATTIGTSKVWPGGGLGLSLSGASVQNKMGMWEGGTARLTHRELSGRVIKMDSASALSGHATSTTGVMLAAGITATAKGMAYATNVKSWEFGNDRAEMATAAPGLLVSNHSYANNAAWYYFGNNWYWLGDTALSLTKDWRFGFYDFRTKQFDSIAFLNPYYLIVKAVGNDRGRGVAPGTPHYVWKDTAYILTTTTRDSVGPYDCIVTYGCAKNILTVGAVDLIPGGYNGPSSVTMMSYSSWGPTDDGRIKPDLVSPGSTLNTSASAHDSAYSSAGGTSYSAPGVTASCLLLQEHYKNLKNTFMRAATLRALVLNTTEPTKTTPGPNYESGWGLMNTAKAANLISDSLNNIIRENILNNNDSFVLYVYAKGNDSLRASIAWTDREADIAPYMLNPSTLMLKNDLDMRITRMNNSQVFQPYVLNPANPAAAATTGDNFRDNIEQIHIMPAAAGLYKIKVTHKSSLLSGNPQAFSLVIKGAYAPPAISSSSLQYSNVTNTSMRLTFQKGNGNRRLVIARVGSAVNTLPVNGNIYSYDSVFGNGSNLGAGNFVVYNGNAASCVVKGLNTNSSYHFAIVEYNGDSAGTLYQNSGYLQGNQSTLPVSWLPLTAAWINDETEVLLQWGTILELNNERFDVERSVTDGEWVTIGSVKGKGLSNRLSYYQFSDNQNQILYSATDIRYRIKQSDRDGQFSYSNIVVLHKEHNNTLTISPNPFSGHFSIQAESPGTQTLKLGIFSLQGKEMCSMTVELKKGMNNIAVEKATDLPDGMYFIELKNGSRSYLFKLVKTR